MDEPSIKGTALSSVVEDVRGLLEQGRIERQALEARLRDKDLELLENKILPGVWYPIDSYQRLSELLLELEGRGNPQYIVARGARAAERIFESGLYAQLRKGMERAAEARQNGEGWAQRDGQLMATLAGAIFNFGRWSFSVEEGSDGAFRIDVLEAEGLPDVARLAGQGFIEFTATRLSGSAALVTSERIAPDHVVYLLRTSFESGRQESDRQESDRQESGR